jgi:hypothetical protein
MTSPVRIKGRERAHWVRPFKAGELDHICDAPGFYEAMTDARSTIALLPDPIAGRDMIETLRQFIVRLQDAARAITELPPEAVARLQGVDRGELQRLTDVSRTLTLWAVTARAAAARVGKPAGRRPDYRQIEAVRFACAICGKFQVWHHVLEVSSLIFDKNISEDAYRRAVKHLTRKPT